MADYETKFQSNWYQAPLTVPYFNAEGILGALTIDDNWRLGTSSEVLDDSDYPQCKDTFSDCLVDSLELAILAEMWLQEVAGDYVDVVHTTMVSEGSITGGFTDEGTPA